MTLQFRQVALIGKYNAGAGAAGAAGATAGDDDVVDAEIVDEPGDSTEGESK